MSASLALQRAVREALLAAPGLAGWPVVDGPEVDEAPPYVTLGPTLETDIGGVEAPLRRIRFAVTLWANGSAVSTLKPAMAAAEVAVLALDPALSVDGGAARLVRLTFLRGMTRREVRAGLVRGEVEFEAIVEV